MTQDSDAGVSRRKFIAASGAGVAGMALAGCSQQGQGTASGGDSGGPLTADGSSTVFPIANSGASVWNSNPPSGDADYWKPGDWGFDTSMNFADFFAQKYGFEPTGQRSNPPYLVNVALSHSGTGVEAVSTGRVDIGNSSGRVQDELPDRDSYEKFTNHVVGVDGQPIAVSGEIFQEGVTELTLQELKQIYRGEITNWSAVGGPDREILVLGRAEGSGTSTAFRANVFGDPEVSLSGIQQRYGQNQQLRTAIQQANNAISYIALAFIDEPSGENPQVVPIALNVEGTTYEYGASENGLGARDYPLSRDLHMYTWEGTSKKEAAFINMFLTEMGQERFVRANNYFKLPQSRREQQRNKLPSQGSSTQS